MKENKTDIPHLVDNMIQKAQALSDALPDSLATNIKQGIKASVLHTAEEMNLVTREELEIQNAVLAKTRAKLEKMESAIAEIEQQLKVQ